MGFKLRQPIKIDPVARYEVPFTPDNIPDNSGLVARANDNGNMIVNKNIPKNSKLRKVAESHEDNHLRAMMDGKLAYDNDAVYHNMDGKGMKKTPRSEFDESDRTTPWEAPAYKAGESMAKVDMRPKKDKLNRSSDVKSGNFAFAFREINKPMRKQDQETVSMSENFGSAMVKKFGKGFNFETKEGGPGDKKKETDVSGNETANVLKDQAQKLADEKLKNMEYQSEVLPDGRIRYFKSTSADATGTITNPGSDDDDSKPSGGPVIGFEEAYKNADKEKYPTFEEFETAARAFNEQKKKPKPTKTTQTATASDEYFEDGTEEETTEEETTDGGNDNGGGDSSTFNYTTSEKKGQNKLFDGSGKRKVGQAVRNLKYRCKQGFFKGKGGKCRRKTEGKRGKIAKFKKKR